ncbi:MAG: FtsX-like permease family protein [Treponema sp.]
MNILKIAFRNLNRQKRRSILLVIAIAFTFFVVICMDGLTRGALKSISGEISKIVGGHVYIIGAQKDADKAADDPANEYLDQEAVAVIEKTLEELNITPQYTIKRLRTDGKLIFEGKELRTQIDGCRFDEEALLHDSILFKEGSWETMKKENAVLLSESVAEELNVKLHDVILMEAKTLNGQLTVAELQVEGIAVNRSPFGGITNYVNFDYAGKITEIPAGCLEVYALFLQNPDMQDQIAQAIEANLGEKAPITSRAQARIISPSNPASNIFTQLKEGKWEKTKFGVATFYDFAPQMVTLMNTLNLIGFGVLVVLLVITMIGISNTFKIIVHERKGEIGTMRSCGIMKRSVRSLFLAEASFLSLIGAVTGLALALIVMQAITFIPISKDSSFSVFTSNGNFTWLLPIIPLLLKFAIIWTLTLLTVSGSASRAANMIPAEALRTGK